MKGPHSSVLLSLGFLALVVSRPMYAQQPFTLFIQPDRAAVRAGSDVRVQVTLKNVSGHEIAVLRSAPDYDYKVEVRDARGKSIAPTELARKLNASGSVRVAPSNVLYPLAPGAILVDEIVVSKLFEMALPGRYAIQVTRQVPQDLGTGVVKSNSITVNVTK
jgi:hypothetical protein